MVRIGQVSLAKIRLNYVGLTGILTNLQVILEVRLTQYMLDQKARLGRLGFVRLVSVRLVKVRPTRSDDWKSDKLVDRPRERVVDVDDEGVGVLGDVTLRHVEQVTELLIGQISFWSGDVLVRVIDDLDISFYYVIQS